MMSIYFCFDTDKNNVLKCSIQNITPEQCACAHIFLLPVPEEHSGTKYSVPEQVNGRRPDNVI